MSSVVPRGRWSVFLVTPDTTLRWYRRLATRTWAQPRHPDGRPALAEHVVALILRLAQEHPAGLPAPPGEPKKLGLRVASTTIRTVLLRNGLRPAPRRASATWRAFLRAQATGIVAIDCFTVATVCLKTLCVLCFIGLHARRVRLAGFTDHPGGPWVVQRAREFSMEVERAAGAAALRFLVRDRDSKFTGAFDDVFFADGAQIITTPIQALAPNANAVAERWVRTVRQEGLDWLLSWGRRHLERVLGETCGTTTTSDRTEALRFTRQGLSTTKPSLVPSRSPPASSAGTTSAAWFMTTRPRRDVRVSEPTGDQVAQPSAYKQRQPLQRKPVSHHEVSA